MLIQGKCASAIAYANVIEPEAIEQIRRMCDYEFTAGSRIRIMPDVHAGKGCTIGTTMTIRDKAVPNVVGVDIGCGMYTVRLNEREIDFARLDEAAHYVPSGMNVWEGRKETFELEALECFRELKDTRRLQRSLGTLGGGNHFIEIDRASDGTMYLVIHSGSRNLGKQVAEYYQRIAVELNLGRGEHYKKRDALIAEYKAAGRRKEIQAALKQLEWTDRPPTIPEELCFVYGEYLEKYLCDVEICQRFARRNRVLIPINMRDGSVLAIGKGNPEWNDSAPHGAGRIMSRTAAREKLNMADYESAMRGVYTTSVNPSTIDEAPMAYKSLADIIDVIRDSVDVVDIMKPVYNFKASD